MPRNAVVRVLSRIGLSLGFVAGVGALACPPLVAAAAEEPCHTTVTSAVMAPVKIVVGVQVNKSSTYTVVLDNNCQNPGLFVNLASTEDVVGQGISMNAPTNDGNGHYTFVGSTVWDPTTMNNGQYAGSWISVIDVFSDDGPSLSGPGGDFSVVRAATVTAKAPATATKGTTISVSGLLTRASWDTHNYQRYGGQVVELQFQKPGGAYATIKTSRSMSNGSVLNSVRADADGCYRYVYRGNAKTGLTLSTGTCVDVR